jgi:hypothetical protein
MGEMITKPDANPILFAALNFLLLGCVGYFLMGQKGKAIASLVYLLVISVITCGGLAIVWQIITAVDAYQLGQKLQAGESIGEKENGLGFLNSLPGFK